MLNYCPYCGARVNDGANFCTSCGARLSEEKKVYQGTVSAPSGAYSEPKKEVSKADSISSMVFGAMSPFFSIFCMFPFIGILFIGLTITFIVLAKSRRNRYVREAGEDNGFSRAGKITSTVAIPLTCFFSLYFLAFTLGIIFA